MVQPADIDDLVSEFAFLEDWEERYRYVIELGRSLPSITAEERVDANKVRGCVSQVWLVSDLSANPEPHLIFRGDSDAHIVRGLAALLVRLCSGRSPKDLLSLDIRNLLERIGLSEHLSPQRSNGLHAMVARMRADAQAAVDRSQAHMP